LLNQLVATAMVWDAYVMLPFAYITPDLCIRFCSSTLGDYINCSYFIYFIL